MTTQVETREFQTEVKQMLDIVINSLYTNKEIFLRELISNASDALEKLRYAKLTSQKILDDNVELEITIESDEEEKTLTITDSGIGMTREELIENLGTIAHSGSKNFLKHLEDSKQQDIDIIGQFGVGFYSAFMVAEKITLYTRSYKPESQSLIWKSDGTGSYTIEETQDLKRGTKIVLHLKEDALEYIKEYTIKRIIKKYSSFIQFPILVNGEKANTIEAIWSRNRNEVSEEEYNEFYKYQANAFDEPLFKLHFKTDAPLSINALLFVPRENMERFGFGKLDPGVNLYCRKILIQQEAEGILPKWLRFVKGVIDSEELPLNISRETMQDNALVAKLRKVITKRFLKFLHEQSKNNAEKYSSFWNQFGIFIKEGLVSDFEYKDELTALLRFESSKSEPGQLIPLQEYVDRMDSEQKHIYYINGASRHILDASPYLEAFKTRDIEVLYTYDPVDDYVLTTINEFDGKELISADQENIDLPETKENTGEELSSAEVSALSSWLKDTLGERVSEVKSSKRLTSSPAMVLNPEGMTNSMLKMMQLMNPEQKNDAPKILAINPRHEIIKGINELRKKEDPFANVAAWQLLDNALLTAGLLTDQSSAVQRMNEVLARALRK
jgi:TNF receptor-associated protein 1